VAGTGGEIKRGVDSEQEKKQPQQACQQRGPSLGFF
jgi:hypothetical protein